MNDAMNGTGTLTLATGAKYHGSWKANTRCGHGVCVARFPHCIYVTTSSALVDAEPRLRYTLVNGDTYDGEWLDDRKNGKGM